MDYPELFLPDAPWPTAAAATSVFKLDTAWVAAEGGATDDEFRREIAGLLERGIAIGMEYEPLVERDCGGTEGFGAGVGGAMAVIRRVEDAGGQVSFIALDEPLAGGHLFSGPRACQWSVEQTAREVAAFVDGIHAVRPDIVVGDIEPWPWVTTPLLAEWLDAYHAAFGAELPFLHLDVDWRVFTGDEWARLAHEVAEDVHAHGSRFGIIYNGCDVGCDGQTDEQWLARAQRNVLDYELAGFGSPDDVIFQSWEDKPDHALPESAPNTFTHLIADYVRTRTTMTIAATPTADGVQVSGDVTTTAGAQAPPADVVLYGTPQSGSFAVYQVRGTVPAGQRTALVGIRANTESAGPGPVDVVLYEIGYAEGAATANRVPMGGSLSTWWPEGTGTVIELRSDHGAGTMTGIRATPAQWILSNSSEFAVTPGSPFRLWAAGRVPEASLGNIRIDLIFLGASSSETSRVALSLAPSRSRLGAATLSADGRYSITVSGLAQTRYKLMAEYAGDGAVWPARARIEVLAGGT